MNKDYEVLKTVQLTRMSETQGIEKYYQAQIKTKGEVILRVDISEEDFTPEKAAPILLKAAQNADAIKKL